MCPKWLDKGTLCTGRVACCLWVALLARGFPLSNVARHGLTDGVVSRAQGTQEGSFVRPRKRTRSDPGLVAVSTWEGVVVVLLSLSSDRLVSHVMVDVGCCSRVG